MFGDFFAAPNPENLSILSWPVELKYILWLGETCLAALSRNNMKPSKLVLSILPETLAICRLEKESPIPDWASEASFFSITRTGEELSIVCTEQNVPEGIKLEGDWRCLRVEDTLDFSLTGVIASLTMPLAFEGISVFVLSTYDTDYVLVKERNLDKAALILSQNGHLVIDQQKKL